MVVGIEEEKEWRFYDAGPKSNKVPLVCLHGVSGSADDFFKQILSLAPKGVRILSVGGPCFLPLPAWVAAWRRGEAVSADRTGWVAGAISGLLFPCGMGRWI